MYRAVFHAGSSHFRANRGGAARCEQPGVRGVARGGARAPRAVAATAELDSKLRSEGFKLCGETRGLFDALSHQLCGTHQLSKYVEHVVIEEIERREAGDGHDKIR